MSIPKPYALTHPNPQTKGSTPSHVKPRTLASNTSNIPNIRTWMLGCIDSILTHKLLQFVSFIWLPMAWHVHFWILWSAPENFLSTLMISWPHAPSQPIPNRVYHDLPQSKRWATIRHQRNPRRRAPRSAPSCVTFSIVAHPSCDCLHSTFCICFSSAVKITSFHRAFQHGRVRGV